MIGSGRLRVGRGYLRRGYGVHLSHQRVVSAIGGANELLQQLEVLSCRGERVAAGSTRGCAPIKGRTAFTVRAHWPASALPRGAPRSRAAQLKCPDTDQARVTWSWQLGASWSWRAAGDHPLASDTAQLELQGWACATIDIT